MNADVQKWMHARARPPAFLFRLRIWFRVHFIDADVHYEKIANMKDIYLFIIKYGRPFYERHNGIPRQADFILFYY